MKTKRPSPLPVRLLMIFLTSLPLLISAAETADSPPSIFIGGTEADKLIAAKKWDEAEKMMMALIGDPGVEADHPALAGLRLKLAGLYRSRNRHGEAFTTAIAAVPALEKTMGRENPFSMSARWMAAGEAMAANKPAEAAEAAAPLLETLREYVGSGRAAAAQWQNVPSFQMYLQLLPRLDESGIAAVSSLLGRALAAAGELDKAAPVLRESVALLEKLHGPGHPDLVTVQQALETIAIGRGEAAGRRYVGDLGSTRRLVFEGNATFPAEVLRKALATHVEFVLASHPSAEFADFPPAIQKALKRGYLHSGFPKTTVEVMLDPLRDGGSLIVRIAEGPRYRMGDVRIEGAKEVDPEKLRQKLITVPKEDEGRSLAGLIRKSMKDYAKYLPAPETKATSAIVEELNNQIPSAHLGVKAGNPAEDAQATSSATDFFDKLALTSDTADWTPGKSMSFSENPENPLIQIVRQRLAELGRPIAVVTTAHEFRDDGTVDLVIRIEDEGAVAVIGRIRVVGCTIHGEEEIAKAAGLTAGQPFNPKALDLATVALWNSGRFFPFAISSQARGSNEKEVDLTIQAREIKGVPPLGKEIAPELEAARRFIATFNEWLATGNFTDFEWTAKGENDEQMVIGVSGRDGLVFGRMGGRERDHQLMSISNEEILFELIVGEHRGRGTLPGLSEMSYAFVTILPTGENDGKLCIGAGAGLSSKARETGRLAIDLILSPAIPLLKPELFVREGGQVVVRTETNTELLRLDMATSLPCSGGSTRFEMRQGVVRERQRSLAVELSAATDGAMITGWMDALVGLEQLSRMMGKSDGNAREFFGTWIRFAALVLKPEVLKPFKNLFVEWSKEEKDPDGFFIPCDPSMLQGQGMTMNLLVGLGAITLSEMLAPPDSWVSKLTREMVFIYGGKTQYTSRTMNDLLADPSIGPFGSMVTAQLLSELDAGTSRRFLSKALEQANQEGFRHDWQFWLDSPTRVGKALDDFLVALAGITPDDEKLAADLLNPAQAEWFHKLLARLRQRPQGQDVAEWIAPQMDELWNKVVGDSLRGKLESLLGPAFDPASVAAVVNGQPVRRVFVKAIEGMFFDPGQMQLPPIDATREWTKDPALSLAIRFTLLEQEIARRGMRVTEAQIKAVLEKGFPELMDQPDEAWVAATGVTREETGYLVANSMLLRGIASSVTESLKPVTDADIESFYQKHGRDLSRRAHLHMIVGDRGDARSVARSRHAARLVRQSAAKLMEGLPFEAMRSAASANSRSGLQLLCESGFPVIDLSPALMKNLETMKPGDMAEPLIGGSKCIVVRFEGWSDGPLRPLAEVKQKIATLIRNREVGEQFDMMCRQYESRADIVILDNPEPAAPETSIFADFLKSDSFGAVGQLGVFWEKAVAKDKDAGDALESVISEGYLSLTELVLLADALLAHDQQALATMCLKEAGDRDPKATRNAIEEAVERHKTRGSKGRQDQIDKLIDSK